MNSQILASWPMEEPFHEVAQHQSQRGLHHVVAEFKRVIPGVYVLKTTADKRFKAITGEAKIFLVL